MRCVVILVAGCGRIAFAPQPAGDGAASDAQGVDAAVPANLIAANVGSTCAISDGALSCWGQNGSGQLLTGDTVDAVTPVAMGSDRDWVLVMPGQDHICGVRAGGKLYCWGDNASGQLGVGDFTPRMTMTRVDLPAAAVALDAWYHTCAVLDTEELYCWGRNSEGQLGQNDTISAPDIPSPVAVGPGLRWAGVSTGQGHTLALTVSGQLYGTGRNTADELGLGPTGGGQYRNLTAVTGAYTGVVAGQSQSCARRADASVACWGDNGYGQLGTGDVAPRDVPTTVSANQRDVDLDTFHACALAQAGTISCWGRNVEGQLGAGDQIDRMSPTLSGSFTDWIQLAVARFHTCGMRSDHSVWCVGQNTGGAIGVPGSALYTTWQRVF